MVDEKFQQDSPFKPSVDGHWANPDEVEGGLVRGEPTPEEYGAEITAPGRRAAYQAGVRYVADYETTEDGMCRHARVHARALHEAGVPVNLRSIGYRMKIDGIHRRAGEDLLADDVYELVVPMLRTTFEAVALTIIHAVTRDPTTLLALALPDDVQDRPAVAAQILDRTIIYAPWECSRVSKRLVDVLNRMGQVWVACARNAEALRDSGVTGALVRTVPNAFDPQSLLARAAKTDGSSTNQRRFYHIGKWEPRKDQHKLLGAFVHRFRPSDGVTLYIKTSPFGEWKNYPGPLDSVKHWLDQEDVKRRGWTSSHFDSKSKQNLVRIDERMLTDGEIVGLHRYNNIYVSCAHGEAWDYPAFDSKVMGNRLVYVGYGGPEDYAASTDIRVPWTTEPVSPEYDWEPGAQWGGYTVEDLSLALGNARVPRERDLQWDRAAAQYTTKGVGKHMAKLVRGLLLEKDEVLSAALGQKGG